MYVKMTDGQIAAERKDAHDRFLAAGAETILTTICLMRLFAAFHQ